MADQPTYLTEAILAIQNEIQTAVDFIETVVSQEPSQLGAAPSLLTVDNIRVRIPFILQPEQETRPLPEEAPTPITGIKLSRAALDILKSRLLTREGLLIGVQEGRLGSFAKIRVLSPTPPAGEAAPAPELVGHIEVTFTRVPRMLEEEAPGTPGAPAEVPPGGAGVPNLLGRTLEDATGLLSSQGWQYQANAASKDEVDAAPESSRGRVVRQEPQAGQPADKKAIVVRFWVALSNMPVQGIDGIGNKLGARLAVAGISTVGQLSLAEAGQVATAMGVSQTRAVEFIHMAGFMSRLVIAGFPDEVVELLVRGAGVRSVEELAAAGPAELYKTCREAIEGGRVRVPAGFSFSSQDVAKWVAAARALTSR